MRSLSPSPPSPRKTLSAGSDTADIGHINYETALEICSNIVNALFRCNRPAAMDQNPETQPIESLRFNEWKIKFFPIYPQEHPQALEGVVNYKEPVEELCKHLDAGE
jgi:hypothetical protein